MDVTALIELQSAKSLIDTCQVWDRGKKGRKKRVPTANGGPFHASQVLYV